MLASSEKELADGYSGRDELCSETSRLPGVIIAIRK